MNDYTDTYGGRQPAVFGVSNEGEKMNDKKTTVVNWGENYGGQKCDRVSISHDVRREFSSMYTVLEVLDLTDEKDIDETFSVSVRRDLFNEELEIVEDSLFNESATVYVNREALILLAREILEKFDTV